MLLPFCTKNCNIYTLTIFTQSFWTPRHLRNTEFRLLRCYLNQNEIPQPLSQKVTQFLQHQYSHLPNGFALGRWTVIALTTWQAEVYGRKQDPLTWRSLCSLCCPSNCKGSCNSQDITRPSRQIWNAKQDEDAVFTFWQPWSIPRNTRVSSKLIKLYLTWHFKPRLSVTLAPQALCQLPVIHDLDQMRDLQVLQVQSCWRDGLLKQLRPKNGSTIHQLLQSYTAFSVMKNMLHIVAYFC